MDFNFDFQLDQAALKHGLIALSVIYDATFLKRKDITNLHLALIAKKARNDISHQWDKIRQQIREESTLFKTKDLQNPPAVVTAMITHHKLFLCSSVRGNVPGGRAFVETLPPSSEKEFLMELLNRAGMVDDNGKQQHRNQANCGELHVIHLWHRIFPGDTIDAIKERSIVTAVRDPDRKKDTYDIIDPCSPDNDRTKEGCITLVKSWGLFAVLQQSFQEFGAVPDGDLKSEQDIEGFLQDLAKVCPEYYSIMP